MTSGYRVFLRRLSSGRIFDNRLLFKNNMLLFSGDFCGIQGLDGGRQSRNRGIPPPR